MPRFTLEELGLSVTKDERGEEQFTIALPVDPIFGVAETRALFNRQTRQWMLNSTTRVKFADKKSAGWKRHDSSEATNKSRFNSAKWVSVLPKTEHVDSFIHSIDWAATSLGPLESWPTSLQAYLNVVFADSQAAVIYWGKDLCAIYNSEMLRLVTGRLTKTTDLMGKPFTEIWPELWADFQPMFKSIADAGTGIETVEVNLFPVIDGIPEETFWQGSFLPIRDNNGIVQGFYNRAREVTKTFIAERRSKVLSSIAAKPNLAGDFVFQHVINALSSCERDFPMAFAYSAIEDVAAGRCSLKFQSGHGVPPTGHPLVPPKLELFESQAGFSPYFRRVKGLDEPVVLHQSDSTLPEEFTRGFDWKGFGEPARSVAIIPLATSDRLLGILVVALNPRRPFDEDYEGFLKSLMRHASATVASAIDREEARLRAERLTRRLEDSEKHIRELALYGPVGIARIEKSGKILWANDQFYEISGHGRLSEDHYNMSFMDLVYPEDQHLNSSLWKSVMEQRKNVSSPFRLKRRWKPPPNPHAREAEEQPVWVLVSVYPITEGDEIKAIATAITDISRFKWAEAVQSKAATAAKEAKRLQENFIDIVSHEMRNPLSAITQLSDAISTALEEFQATSETVDRARDILSTNAENAKTILLCAAHQKRIIDDVLTLSKLDSMMLSITPVVVKPYHIVQSVLKMFEGEFTANDIQVESEKHVSYDENKVEWVNLDPSRLTQIFINLITNAIKFTKLEKNRQIRISVGASHSRPPSVAGVTWFPTDQKHKDLTLGPEWGEGKPIFISFEVQDTGRGLEQSEMTKLFGRFQQATAKTHIKYGGSGLGLFISRELTETQGGEIGVMSERGKGTTFAFYVKGRRADAPEDPKLMLHHTPANRTPREQNRQALEQQDTQMTDSEDLPRATCVLLVEDNIINAQVLTKQLQKANCEVHIANHGMEAIDWLSKTKAWEGTQNETEAIDFDVVLMDVEMPIMDGLTCTRRIRQLEEEKKLRRHTNIIAITANARQEQIETVLSSGADDVLPKPFRVKECLEKIRLVTTRDFKGAKRRKSK